ncbi:carbohydrate kinase family protein [Streptomyces avidinii]
MSRGGGAGRAGTGPGGAAVAAGPGALLVVGDVVTDVVAVHAHPLAPATDTPARIRTLPGGAGANAACWAARTGLTDVRILARVGADSARWHEQALLDAGVRPTLVIDPDEPTGTVVALVGGDAERTFLTDSGASLRLTPADWVPGLLDGVSHLHLSGYLFFADSSRELARLALREALARDVPVSVDPASAGFLAALGPGRFLDAVAGVGVLLPNEDEALLLAGLSPAPACDGPGGPGGQSGPGGPGGAGGPGGWGHPGARGKPGGREELGGSAGRGGPGGQDWLGGSGGQGWLGGSRGRGELGGPVPPAGSGTAARPGDVARAAAELSRRVPLVVVTRGAAGALIAEDGRVTAEVAAESAQAVDSTGAGDAFTGAFLAARLAGAGSAWAAGAGCRAAAEAVTRQGGRP